MPNTVSAKKALRQSKTRQQRNLAWKKRIKSTIKKIDGLIEAKEQNVAIIKEELRKLYKTTDKAAKTNSIHKNKAKRIKAKVAKKVTAHEQQSTKTKATTKSKSKSS